MYIGIYMAVSTLYPSITYILIAHQGNFFISHAFEIKRNLRCSLGEQGTTAGKRTDHHWHVCLPSLPPPLGRARQLILLCSLPLCVDE